jgi:erythromycin esterase
MIQWLREYNALHPNEKVEFAAFDIQDIKQPTDSLFAYLKTKNERLFDSVSTCLSELVQKPGDHFNASDTIKYKWMISADKAFQMVQSQKSSLLSDAKTWNDTLTVERNIQYANLVRQYARNLYLGHASLYRDTAMAENVSWILSIQPPGSKMLIWAHDMHISKGADPVRKNDMYNGISMGAHLAKKYGTAYKAFGLSTYKGSYWAQVSYTDFRMMDCPLLDAPRGSLDEALHRVSESYNNKLIFLDLTTARNEQWLIKPLPVRFANHVNIEYGYWSRYSVPYQFDGIFFIDSTSAARSYAK